MTSRMTPTEPALSGKVSDLVPGGGWRSFLALLIIQGQNAFMDMAGGQQEVTKRARQ